MSNNYPIVDDIRAISNQKALETKPNLLGLSRIEIKILLKKFPGISSGRKNFKYFEKRIHKNLLLSHKYSKINNRT